MDDKACRIETDRKNARAIADFGDTKLVALATDIFDKVFEESESNRIIRVPA